MPRPCGVPSRPERGRRETGMGDHKGRPYTRTARRRGPRRGDPCGRPPESATASFPSYEVACHALAASRPGPNEAIGKTGMGDDKRRPYTRTARRWRATPLRRPVSARTRPSGKPAWVTTSVAPTPEHPGGGVPRPCGAPCRPERGHRENRHGRRQAWATTSVAPTPEHPGGGVPRPCGAPCRPERGRRETGMGDGAPCGRERVAPTRMSGSQER